MYTSPLSFHGIAGEDKAAVNYRWNLILNFRLYSFCCFFVIDLRIFKMYWFDFYIKWSTDSAALLHVAVILSWSFGDNVTLYRLCSLLKLVESGMPWYTITAFQCKPVNFRFKYMCYTSWGKHFKGGRNSAIWFLLASDIHLLKGSTLITLRRRIELYCKENIFGHQFFCDTKSRHFNTFIIWHYWIKKYEILFLAFLLCVKWNYIYKLKDMPCTTDLTCTNRSYWKPQPFVPITFSNHDIIMYSKCGVVAEWSQRMKVLTHPQFHKKCQTS